MSMLRIKASECKDDCELRHERTVKCPICKKRLFNVELASGAIIVRMKCPRCRQFIDIEATGVE